MSNRKPQSRSDMEQMILSALKKGGYQCQRNVSVKLRLSVAEYSIHIRAEDKKGRVHLISFRWQQVHGTTEQKIPFEVICLIDAIQNNKGLHKAYLILGGNGWNYKKFYLSGGLNNYLKNSKIVEIISVEDFVYKASQGKL